MIRRWNRKKYKYIKDKLQKKVRQLKFFFAFSMNMKKYSLVHFQFLSLFWRTWWCHHIWNFCIVSLWFGGALLKLLCLQICPLFADRYSILGLLWGCTQVFMLHIYHWNCLVRMTNWRSVPWMMISLWESLGYTKHNLPKQLQHLG